MLLVMGGLPPLPGSFSSYQCHPSRESGAGSTPELTSSYVRPCGLESVQWPSGATTQPLESKKALDSLSLSLLSPELQAGVGEGHGRRFTAWQRNMPVLP